MIDRKIAVVGVGRMGHGIAKNIQAKGWPLGFLDHPGNQPTDDLVAKGAKVFTSLAELSADSDVVIICVTGSPEVEDVLTRQDGILAGLKDGAVIVDCSTAIPTSTQKLAELVQTAGGRFLDAPMTRTPKEAEEGRLNLIVGGDADLFEEQRPLLESYAENIVHTGPIGSGHTLKLLHNFVSLGFSAVMAEAVAASNRAGVDPKVLHEVLSKGGGASVILDRMTPFILNEDVGSFVFSLSNSAKDIGYYNAMCADLQAHQTVAQSILAMLTHQIETGHGDSMIPELIGHLSKDQTP